MTSPKKFVIRMVLFLMAVGIGCSALFTPLQAAFLANIALNSLILGVLVLGIAYNFRQTFMLFSEVAWINSYRKPSSSSISSKRPRLLFSMATLLGEHKDGMSLSTLSMRSLLDGIASRLDESRDLSRYNIGLLIFLGLLGTFWGLLETINSVGNTVSSLDFSENTQKLFKVLKLGLEQPLNGMGTAFSSSLFGLSGSLILGFLDLQSNQAQNRFYNEVEEKLSERTKFSLLNLDQDDKKNLAPAYIESLIEVTTENLKKSTSVIDKQNTHQESLAKSISEINNLISENIELNKNISEEIRVLSKTIANVNKKQ